ncbi:MAG: hypothetical protein Kow00124_10460 [Anaerolineae bacterium]
MVVTVEGLDDALNRLWAQLCRTYDVIAPMPGTAVLFDEVDLRDPREAAETVLAHMLSEIIQLVDRYSPWYTRPARAFGLIQVRESTSNHLRWVLAPEAAARWEPLLDQLTAAMADNSGLIRATQIIDEVSTRLAARDQCVEAACSCRPPRVILINRSILSSESVTCAECQAPFREML